MLRCFAKQNAHQTVPTKKGEHSCKCTELSLKQKVEMSVPRNGSCDLQIVKEADGLLS